jgi:hypothetical protein
MYVVLWRFRPREGRQSEFERAYGPSGEWALLFRRSDGYLGTELLSSAPRTRDSTSPWTAGPLALPTKHSELAGATSIGGSTIGWKSSPRRRHFSALSRRYLESPTRLPRHS